MAVSYVQNLRNTKVCRGRAFQWAQKPYLCLITKNWFVKKVIPLIVLLVMKCAMANAQQWFQDMYDPSVNFFTVQQEFNDWWQLNKQAIMDASKEQSLEGELEGNWVLYKRWEHQILPAMIASGGVRQGVFDSAEFNFNKHRGAASVLRSGTPAWTYIGPEDGFAPGGVVGCKGRLNCVRFDPVNHNIIYVGAPSGGIWKSPDAGQTWALLNTDTLVQIGVTDIAIDPNNTQHLFIATGDYANQASMSIGVLQSINGGLTWNTTGLTWTISQGIEISRLIMDPLNPAVLLAATNKGIYRTTNSGSTWTEVSTLTQVSSMEFMPGSDSVIYACNTRLYRSVNGGVTWVTAGTGLPTTGLNALAIGVTPADNNCVYVLASESAQSSMAGYNLIGGLYRSEDSASTFVLRSVPSQLITQGVYDLTVGVSPINKNVLAVGAEASAFSDDGGLTFKYPATDAHVDHHDIRFLPNSASEVYSADDGGLFVSADSGNTWIGKGNGLNIGQIYVVAPSGRTSELDMTGRQDDGTLLQENTTANSLAPGDGTNCVMDPTNDSILYGSIQQGIFARSVDLGHSYILITQNWLSGVNGPSEWVTPFVLDPQTHSTAYIGKDFIYKSENEGSTWQALNTPTLSSGVYWHYIAVAPSDPRYIYACSGGRMVRSSNGGLTFVNIPLTGNNGTIWSFAVAYNNPKKIWVATSKGVVMSIDTGHTWTNFSTGLPAVTSYYPYTIACLKNAPGALYLGLHNGGGVYYTDSTITGWVPFGTGLPNTSVENIEISYASGKVRAATYGRDLWECNLNNNWYNPPVAQFDPGNDACVGQTVQFNDASSFNPTSWQWTFNAGSPSTANTQNPEVLFPGPGTYSVTLTASNSYGTNTVTQYIVVGACTGIEETSLANSIAVYPNPTNSLLIAESGMFVLGKTTVQVFDITGRMIIVPVEIEANKILLHTDNLAEGTYILKIQSGENTAAKRFIKAG